MRMLLSALAAIAFGGLCSHANAQAQCPELTRLRGESPETIVDSVMKEVERFAPGHGDDRTLLVLRL